MVRRVTITICMSFVIIGIGAAWAQERVPLPPPDGAQNAAPPPPSAQPNIPPPPPYSTPPPDAPAPPYGPAPGMYPHPYSPPPGYSPPLVYAPAFDPVGNPFFWLGAEGLIWWTKGQTLSVPVITTGPGLQGPNAGALGAPGTTSISSPLNYGVAGGVRLFAGGWFDMGHTIGIDGSLFILGQNSTGFGATDGSGTGQFVINEPVAGAPFVTQVSAPGVGTGSAFVNTRSQFGGGDVNLLYNLHRGNGWTVNLLGGFRYLQLNESLSIVGNSTTFVPTTFTDGFGNTTTFAAGSGITSADFFGTRNSFYGGQLGAQVQYQMGRWYFNGIGKAALGGTCEVVNASGNFLVVPPTGAPVNFSGGNFVTNQAGHYAVSRFAFAPEMQLKVGYQITPWMRGVIGYDLLYLSSVVRPGNQIDNLFDGGAHPLIPMASSSFWTQGLNLGLHFSY